MKSHTYVILSALRSPSLSLTPLVMYISKKQAPSLQKIVILYIYNVFSITYLT